MGIETMAAKVALAAEPEYLQVVSVNIWQILISLANLLLLFLILKKFLYKPVKKVLDARKAAIDEENRVAAKAREDALAEKAAWEEKLAHAGNEADAILQQAKTNAERRSDSIVEDARREAEGILRRAEKDAALERKKAEAGIRQELAGVSAELAEKLLEREINENDHKKLIDSFIRDIEVAHDGRDSE